MVYLICDICGMQFTNQDDLNIHVEDCEAEAWEKLEEEDD